MFGWGDVFGWVGVFGVGEVFGWGGVFGIGGVFGLVSTGLFVWKFISTPRPSGEKCEVILGITPLR